MNIIGKLVLFLVSIVTVVTGIIVALEFRDSTFAKLPPFYVYEKKYD